MQADRGAQFVTGLDNSQYFMRHSAVNYKDRFYPNEEEDLMCDSGKYFYKLVGITNYYGPKENEEGQIYHYGEEGEDIGNNQSGNINGFTTQKEYEGDNTGNLNNSGTLRGKNKNIRGGNKVGNKNKAGAKGGKNNLNNNANNINIGGIGGMSEEEMSNQLMGQKRSNYKEDNITCTHSWKGNEEIPEIGVKSAVANVKFVWENGRRKKITTTVRTMINGEVNTEITKEDAF